MKQNVAFLGLSGDPAHRGHLTISKVIHENLGYNRVLWSIAPANPFKPGNGRAPYAHREALAEILVHEEGGPWLKLMNFEAALMVLLEETRTYTTMQKLCEVYGEIYNFTFIMGSDNWKYFHTWGRFQEILDHCAILIINRGDDWESLKATPAALALMNRQDPATEGPVTPHTWRLMDYHRHHPSSSTAIAAQLAAGETPEDLTPGQLAYIRQHKLYNVR